MSHSALKCGVRDDESRRRALPSDLTDEQWELAEPVLCPPSKRGPKHGPDLRTVVDAMLYISHTGCQWWFLPAEFGPWTRVWSQFRRWSRNGTWQRAVAALDAEARVSEGRTEPSPSMVVIDGHLSRGAANGGVSFHDRGGAYGRTNGAKRMAAVDVCGLPLAGLVVPASMHDNDATEALLADIEASGQGGRLELVLVDRGVSERAARRLSRQFGCEVRRVGWDDPQLDERGRRVFRPIRHAWRVEVAHGRLGRRRRLARSFEGSCASATTWLHVACAAMLLGVIFSGP